MFFTQASIAMVALIVLIMVTSILIEFPFFGDATKVGEQFKAWIKYVIGFGVLLVLFMFANSGGISLLTNFGIRIPGIDQGDLGVILLVIGTGVVILLATRTERGGS